MTVNFKLKIVFDYLSRYNAEHFSLKSMEMEAFYYPCKKGSRKIPYVLLPPFALVCMA